MGVLLLPHRRFEADGVLRQLQQLPHPGRLHVQLGGDLLDGRLPACAAQQLPRRLLHPVDALHQMHRDADGAALIGDGPGDGLPDPPCGVGGKLEAPVRFELLRRLHQAEVPLLNEVEERQAPPGVPLCHRDHEAEVRFAETAAGVLIPGLRGTGEGSLLLRGQQGHPADLLQIGLYRVVQRHPLGRKLILEPADLLFVQKRQLCLFLGHLLVQPCRVEVLFLHRTAHLLGRQDMAAGASRQQFCHFFRL